MKIISNFRKFQEGGAMPVEGPVPAEGGAPQEMPAEGPQGLEQMQDPMQQILQVAAQALQSQNCEAAMAVCQALLQLVQSAAGGPEQEAPQEEPTFARHGAKLIRINR